MHSRSETRRASRADAWATISGKARPTCQKRYSVNVFPEIMGVIVVYAAKRIRMGRGAHRERSGCRRRRRLSGGASSSRAQIARQGLGASPIINFCPHCFLCCGRAGGNGHAMHDSLDLKNLTLTRTLTRTRTRRRRTLILIPYWYILLLPPLPGR